MNEYQVNEFQKKLINYYNRNSITRKNINILHGKTLKYIHVSNDTESIIFIVSENEMYLMFHQQDCCESVMVEDICGELDWLIDTPILRAEERTNHSDISSFESTTWTFYELATIKGSVTIRWIGSSNGYYGESVDFIEVCNECN